MAGIRHTADTITDDALDELYEQVARVRELCANYERWQDEGWQPQQVTPGQVAREFRAALDGEPRPDTVLTVDRQLTEAEYEALKARWTREHSNLAPAAEQHSTPGPLLRPCRRNDSHSAHEWHRYGEPLHCLGYDPTATTTA